MNDVDVVVDVIVLDVDGGEMLQRCFDSLVEQTVKPRRIIVFDNGSRVPVQDRLRGDADIMRSDRNIGFAAGANAAYQESGAPLIALVNNDVILDRDWVAELGAAFDDAGIGAAQTVIRRDETTVDGAGIDISDGTIRQIGYGLPIGTPLTLAWGVSATAAIYRREAAGDHLFDARFFAYYEDVELSARLHQSGWRTVVLPVVKATHRGSASAPLLGHDAARLRTRNRYWVARRHPGVGRIASLLAEDLRLLPRGRSSLRGIVQGLFGPHGRQRGLPETSARRSFG